MFTDEFCCCQKLLNILSKGINISVTTSANEVIIFTYKYLTAVVKLHMHKQSVHAYRACIVHCTQQVTQCWPITDPESIESLDANDTEVPGWPQCSLHAAAGGTTAPL